jgi:hypothetical protein
MADEMKTSIAATAYVGISEVELVALISVAKAYGVRSVARSRAKEAKTAKERARKELSHYGGFADCGDSYQSSYDEASGVFDAAVSAEISSEKAYKKARLTAIERHPRLAELIPRFVHEDA